MRGAGPFRTDQLRSGDPYELSNGHAIRCAPAGGDGSGPNLRGGFVLDSDPAVKNPASTRASPRGSQTPPRADNACYNSTLFKNSTPFKKMFATVK